jgi:dihydrofolate reductase
VIDPHSLSLRFKVPGTNKIWEQTTRQNSPLAAASPFNQKKFQADISCQSHLLCLRKNQRSMRKIILGLAVTLDGLIEGPRGEYDWCFTDQDYGMTDFLKNVDAIFYGRKSYEMMMKAEGKNPFGGNKSYVFSNSWKKGGQDFELISGDIVTQVMSIKESKGKNIWLFGGASLTASLIDAGLVDEIWLSVHPILIGAGKPLFSGIHGRISLELLETKPYDTGLVSLRYNVLNKGSKVKGR